MEKLKTMEEIKAEIAGRTISNPTQPSQTTVAKQVLAKSTQMNLDEKKQGTVERGLSAGDSMERFLKETFAKAQQKEGSNEQYHTKAFGTKPNFVKKIASGLTSIIRSLLFILVGVPIIAIIDLVKDIIYHHKNQ